MFPVARSFEHSAVGQYRSSIDATKRSLCTWIASRSDELSIGYFALWNSHTGCDTINVCQKETRLRPSPLHIYMRRNGKLQRRVCNAHSSMRTGHTQLHRRYRCSRRAGRIFQRSRCFWPSVRQRPLPHPHNLMLTECSASILLH